MSSFRARIYVNKIEGNLKKQYYLCNLNQSNLSTTDS